MKRRTIGHYEIQRKIGAGGSGVVYLATDTLLQRPVVIKLLKRGALSLEQVRATQLREARLASAIDHPNVAAIYDVGEAPSESGGEDEAYIVMQYIPGKSLDKVIAEGPASLQLALSAGIQIADGLSAAHQLGIFHRDLKPANVMLTDGGLIKILDFGLARRLNPDEADFDPTSSGLRNPPLIGATYTARGGTIAYMAPEQFVTGRSSVQSDVFALGLILYELVSGRHPFRRADVPDFQTIRATQFADPPSLREIVPDLPVELESLILRCLEKQPSARFASAADVREALRTAMKALQLDSVGMPGDAVSQLPAQGLLELEAPEEEKRATGLLSMLAERFRESGATASARQNSIVVLPFVNFGNTVATQEKEPAPLYGYALADAIAARLARMTSLVVRPSSSLMAIPAQQLDPLSIGKKLLVRFVLAGNFLRSAKGFDLNWQLLDIPTQSVRAGGSINVASFDLIRVQTEICNEVFSTLQGFGDLENPAATTDATRDTSPSPSRVSLNQALSEEYLQARAVLSSFISRTGSLDDLNRACEMFSSVIKQDEDYAPAWSGLGIAHLQYARHGLGGQMHVLEARRAFDRALQLDPGSVEANLYRVYMLLSRGEKESARHGIEHLLQSAANDWNVHLVAGHDPAHRRPLRGGARPVQHLAAPQPVERRHHLQPPRARLPVSEPARTRRRGDREGPHAGAAPAAAAHLARLPADAPRRPADAPSKRWSRSSPTSAACASSSPPSPCATSSSATAPPPPASFWKRRSPQPRPTARWPIAWRPTLRSMATSPRPSTGCAAPSTSATKIIPGSPRTPHGAGSAATPTSSASSKTSKNPTAATGPTGSASSHSSTTSPLVVIPQRSEGICFCTG